MDARFFLVFIRYFKLQKNYSTVIIYRPSARTLFTAELIFGKNLKKGGNA